MAKFDEAWAVFLKLPPGDRARFLRALRDHHAARMRARRLEHGTDAEYRRPPPTLEAALASLNVAALE